jgi:hypothetical protein
MLTVQHSALPMLAALVVGLALAQLLAAPLPPALRAGLLAATGLASLATYVPAPGATWFERGPATQRALCARTAATDPGRWEYLPLGGGLAPVGALERFVLHVPMACRGPAPPWLGMGGAGWAERNVTFVGDSVVRFLFHAYVATVLDASHGVPPGAMHADLREGGARFVWAPFAADLVGNVSRAVDAAQSSLLVFGAGPWDALHKRDPQLYRAQLQQLAAVLRRARAAARRPPLFVWVEFGTLDDAKMIGESKRQFLVEAKARAFRDAGEEAMAGAAACDAVLPMVAVQRSRTTRDGVHYDFATYRAAVGVLLNMGL